MILSNEVHLPQNMVVSGGTAECAEMEKLLGSPLIEREPLHGRLQGLRSHPLEKTLVLRRHFSWTPQVEGILLLGRVLGRVLLEGELFLGGILGDAPLLEEVLHVVRKLLVEG